VSHWTTVKTQIKDVQALIAAATELGLAVELPSPTGQRPVIRGYATMRQEVDLAVKLKGRYDVGFLKQPDGTYQMTADWWQGHVAAEIGAEGGRLCQVYVFHVIAIQARKKGLGVFRSVTDDGSLRVVLHGRTLP